MKPKHLARFGLLLPMLAICGGEIQDLTQAEKNAFLSRKKWYVTAEFYLNGNGNNGGDYAIDSSTRVRLELNHAIPGQWPLSSPPDPGSPPPIGRYISWMTMPTKEAMEAMGRGETNPDLLVNQYYKMSADVNARFVGSGIDTLRGSGPGYALGNSMLSLDLKEGVFDFVFQVGGAIWPKVTHAWDYPDPPNGKGDGSEEQTAQYFKAGMDPKSMTSLSHRILRNDLKPDGSIQFTIRSTGTVPGYGGGPCTVAYSAIFRISPTPPTNAKLILRPNQEYREWRPIPGEDEDKAGNSLAVDWLVNEPGVPKPKVKKVTFRLGGVSKYPGVCMNWPPQTPPPPAGTPDKMDLAFKKMPPSTADYTLRENNLVLVIDGNLAKQGSGMATVDCFDGAAIGELVAEAEMEDGRILQGEVSGQTASNKILIPDREEGVSELARHWRSQKSSQFKDGDDLEVVPLGDSGQGPGDGLTVWEEYRGFYQGGGWVDNCLPGKKDLFIQNQVGPSAQAGIDLFRKVMDPLQVHDELEKDERLANRVINFHKRPDRWVVDQHCLVMRSIKGGIGVAEAIPNKDHCGPPKNTEWVNVVMRQDGDRWHVMSSSTAIRRNKQSAHIAHELGHAVGIHHHGVDDPWIVPGVQYGIRWILRTVNGVHEIVEGSGAGPKIDIFTESPLNPVPILNVVTPRDPEYICYLGVPQGQHSGDVDCIMRYSTAEAYPIVPGPPTNRRIVDFGRQMAGGSLCTSAAGTLFNATTHRPQSRFGDAASGRGDCLHQFVISDKWEIQYR